MESRSLTWNFRYPILAQTWSSIIMTNEELILYKLACRLNYKNDNLIQLLDLVNVHNQKVVFKIIRSLYTDSKQKSLESQKNTKKVLYSILGLFSNNDYKILTEKELECIIKILIDYFKEIIIKPVSKNAQGKGDLSENMFEGHLRGLIKLLPNYVSFKQKLLSNTILNKDRLRTVIYIKESIKCLTQDFRSLSDYTSFECWNEKRTLLQDITSSIKHLHGSVFIKLLDQWFADIHISTYTNTDSYPKQNLLLVDIPLSALYSIFAEVLQCKRIDLFNHLMNKLHLLYKAYEEPVQSPIVLYKTNPLIRFLNSLFRFQVYQIDTTFTVTSSTMSNFNLIELTRACNYTFYKRHQTFYNFLGNYSEKPLDLIKDKHSSFKDFNEIFLINNSMSDTKNETNTIFDLWDNKIIYFGSDFSNQVKNVKKLERSYTYSYKRTNLDINYTKFQKEILNKEYDIDHRYHRLRGKKIY